VLYPEVPNFDIRDEQLTVLIVELPVEIKSYCSY